MNTITKKIFAAVAVTLVTLSAARAQTTNHTPSPAVNQTEMADAEVRKVDKEAGKLTLKHGPIKLLDMPGMTMVFLVRDKALLDNVKEGDKIKFSVVLEGRNYVVTSVVPN